MGENAFRRPCNFKELRVVKKAHITTCALCACWHLCTASAEQIFPRDSVQRNCFELALYTARDHDCISNRIGSGIRSAMQMSSRYVRCAANDVDDRTDHHANRSSASGPSSSPVAAPYRESGLVLWRKAVSQREIAAELRKGRSRLRALPHCAAAGDRALRCVKRYGGSAPAVCR